MVRLAVLALFVLVVGSTSVLAGNCTRPPAPAVPDGTVASRDDMIAGSQAVKGFMTATERYLDCLKVEESLIPPDELTAEKQKELIERHNAAVEDMERVAGEYNTAVRDFKARVEGSEGN